MKTINMGKPNKQPQAAILENGVQNSDLQTFKDWADWLVEAPNPLTTSQIRKFFGEIKKIQADFDKLKGQIVMLDPKMAYAVGRAKKGNTNAEHKVEDFYKLLSPLIMAVQQDKKKFNHFVDVVESIVAYHKAMGGKEN
jgi:CRISPR type III-A-associated protein Csm2